MASLLLGTVQDPRSGRLGLGRLQSARAPSGGFRSGWLVLGRPDPSRQAEPVKLFRILLRPRRVRTTARRTAWSSEAFKSRWKGLKPSLPHLDLVSLRIPQRPFFTALHELLDRHPVITLGQLLQEAGEQVWGLTVLILAMLTFIPGVANVVSVATLLAGIGMMRKSPHPWLPQKLQRMELHRGRVKEMLAKVESRLAWLATDHRERRAPSERLLGFLVAWSAFIALLPMPLPFANMFPAVALILFGVALLEEWPSLAWYGAAISLGTTIYFAFSIRQILIMLAGMWRWAARCARPGLF